MFIERKGSGTAKGSANVRKKRRKAISYKSSKEKGYFASAVA